MGRTFNWATFLQFRRLLSWCQSCKSTAPMNNQGFAWQSDGGWSVLHHQQNPLHWLTLQLTVPSPHEGMQKERDEKPEVVMPAAWGEAEEFKTKTFTSRFPITAKSFREACYHHLPLLAHLSHPPPPTTKGRALSLFVFALILRPNKLSRSKRHAVAVFVRTENEILASLSFRSTRDFCSF